MPTLGKRHPSADGMVRRLHEAFGRKAVNRIHP